MECFIYFAVLTNTMKKELVLFIGILCFSCQEPNHSEGLNKLSLDDDAKFNRELETIRKDILDIRELTFMLKEDGYIYNSQLLNDLDNSNDYFNSKEQALNIGVYATDLNYMTVFDQNNLSLSYASTIFDLAEELSISEAFDKEYLFQILKNNIPNYRLRSDEINDVFEQAKSEINTAERAQITSLIIAGGWIEGMFISTSLARENWPNENMAEEMWNQCFSYHKVMNMLSIFKDYPPCDVVYSKFKELEPAVNNITNGSPETLKNHLDSFHGIISDLREFIIEK